MVLATFWQIRPELALGYEHVLMVRLEGGEEKEEIVSILSCRTPMYDSNSRLTRVAPTGSPVARNEGTHWGMGGVSTTGLVGDRTRNL